MKNNNDFNSKRNNPVVSRAESSTCLPNCNGHRDVGGGSADPSRIQKETVQLGQIRKNLQESSLIYQHQQNVNISIPAMSFLPQFFLPHPYYMPRFNNDPNPTFPPHLNPFVMRSNLSFPCFRSVTDASRENLERLASNNGKHNKTQKSSMRYWEKLAPIGGSRSAKDFVFSVMCYNVLAQDLVTEHPHLYTFHDRNHLKWTVRWQNILAEVTKLNPDILCLQEVQGSHIKDFYSTLELKGYQGVYKQRTGIRTDGCAIYYKTDKLQMTECTTVEYNQPNIKILDRDNVAVIAKLVPKEFPSEEFLIVTTHLLYNPRRQDIKLAQMQLLMAEIDRLAYKSDTKYVPVILTGDLNSTPLSKIYEFIIGGKLKYEHLATYSLNATNSKTNVVGKNLVPASLGITDRCQHFNLVAKRQGKRGLSRDEEIDMIHLRHSEWQISKSKTTFHAHENNKLFNSGTLSHQFPFISVYDHFADGHAEGTTFQNEWITVDYIFYSGKSADRDDKVVEDKLKLLARYKLLHDGQLENKTIPDDGLVSDHFSLMAKFKLII